MRIIRSSIFDAVSILRRGKEEARKAEEGRQAMAEAQQQVTHIRSSIVGAVWCGARRVTAHIRILIPTLGKVCLDMGKQASLLEVLRPMDVCP